MGSGLNGILYRKLHLRLFSKSEINFFADISISLNFEEREEKTLHIDVTPSGRPFMKIKNKRGPSTDHCGTSVFIFLQ